MNNPIETPPQPLPEPTKDKAPLSELPVPDIATGLDTTLAATPGSAEIPTDAEVMRTLSVHVPYTAEEIAAAKNRLDNDYIEPEILLLSTDEQNQQKREGLENLRKVVELMDDFELKYPLRELNAITTISLAELVAHPVRKPANAALVHIRKAMALSLLEKMPELNERYLRFAQAVGMYNSISKTIDHDRG
ncbi:MAG: hypothetical protein WAT81_00965 [Candidatus Moraniibacteriota bacterium]